MKILRNTLLPEIEIKDGAEELYSVKKHSHNELSIGIIENSSSLVGCKDLDFRLNPGDMILIPANTIHLCEPENPDDFLFKMIYIDSKWFEDVFKINPSLLPPVQKKLNTNQLLEINTFINNFSQINERMELETELIFFMENIIFEIFSIDKNFTQHQEDDKDDRIKNYLDQNFTDDLTLEDLEKISGKNKFSILRKFRKDHKLTPHSYIINKRIELAKKLLLNKDSIADIAVNTGFFDQSHFIKTFKNYVGMTPSQYK